MFCVGDFIARQRVIAAALNTASSKKLLALLLRLQENYKNKRAQLINRLKTRLKSRLK